MRIIFLCIILINIIFFIWEYRKGAPEIYLPVHYENNSVSDKYQYKILLLAENDELQSTQKGAKINAQQPTATSNDAGSETLIKESKTHGIVNYSTSNRSVKSRSLIIF